MECRARAHYLKLLFQSLSSQPTNKNIELKLTLHRKLKHYHVETGQVNQSGIQTEFLLIRLLAAWHRETFLRLQFTLGEGQGTGTSHEGFLFPRKKKTYFQTKLRKN